MEENKGFKVNEKTLELFMVLLQRDKSMFKEILDLSSCWTNYSTNSSNDTNNFYLSEAILRLESKGQKDYYESLIHSQYKNEEKNQIFTLSKIKALIKDNQPEAALRMFEEDTKNYEALEFK